MKKTYVIIFLTWLSICGIIGLIFSTVGIFKFKEDFLLFLIGIGLSLIGLVIGIFKILNMCKTISKTKFNRYVESSIYLLGGIMLIISSLYVFLDKNSSLIIKGVAIFGVIFFGYSVYIIVTRLMKIPSRLRN